MTQSPKVVIKESGAYCPRLLELICQGDSANSYEGSKLKIGYTGQPGNDREATTHSSANARGTQIRVANTTIVSVFHFENQSRTRVGIGSVEADPK